MHNTTKKLYALIINICFRMKIECGEIYLIIQGPETSAFMGKLDLQRVHFINPISVFETDRHGRG